LHLDSTTRSMIDEFSTSNFLAIAHASTVPTGRTNGVHPTVPTLVVPESRSILHSITTKSIIQIATDTFGFQVERRPVEFAEVTSGKFQEVAAVGTAAAVTPVRTVSFTGKALGLAGDVVKTVPIGDGLKAGPWWPKFLFELTGIQSGDRKDLWEWCWPAQGITPSKPGQL